MSQQFRLQLAGSYNTRQAAVNALSSSSGVIGAGVIGVMIIGNAGVTTTKDQRFVNCFTERVVNPYTGKTTLYLVKRPGFASSLTPSAGNIGNDVMIWTGNASKIISAFGATNSTVYDSTTSLGAITGKATGLSETFVGSNLATVVTPSTDNTAWYYDTGVGVMTKIADADFPGNAGKTLAGTFAHMDGYPFIMDTTGAVHNGDLNSITAWTAGASISANSYPDIGVGCIRNRDKIMAFGTESVQFFHNVGYSSGSPLQRIEPMTLKVGCVAAAAVTFISDTVFWAGSSPQGGLAIYKYSNNLERVSTPEIDALLILAGTGNISLSATKFYGRSFVIITASTVIFVYCVEENSWHEWNSSVPLWTRCAGVSAGSTQVTYAVSKSSTSGKVFTINPASLTFQDNGEAYTATVQTSLVGEGNRRTFWEEVEVIGDRQTSASDLTIAVSDDDYQNSTVLGTVDLSAARPRLTRCGSAYRRSWILSHSANTAMRIESLAGRKTVGSG